MKLMMGLLGPIHPRASQRGLSAVPFASTLAAMVEVQVFYFKLKIKPRQSFFSFSSQAKKEVRG